MGMLDREAALAKARQPATLHPDPHALTCCPSLCQLLPNGELMPAVLSPLPSLCCSCRQMAGWHTCAASPAATRSGCVQPRTQLHRGWVDPDCALGLLLVLSSCWYTALGCRRITT